MQRALQLGYSTPSGQWIIADIHMDGSRGKHMSCLNSRPDRLRVGSNLAVVTRIWLPWVFHPMGQIPNAMQPCP